jgi:hypothetical protein
MQVEVWFQPTRNLALQSGGWSTPRFGPFTPGNEPVQEAELASEPVWKISLTPGLDSLTFRMKSLYELRYPDQKSLHFSKL